MALAGRVKPAEGRILLLEGGLEANSGLRQESIASLKRAHEICLETHDDICVAGMLRVEGNRRIFSNEYGEALRFYDRALPLALRWQNSWEAGNILEGIELASERLRTLGDSHKLVSLIAAERPVAQFR